MFDHDVNLNNIKSPADLESKQLNLIDFTFATPYIDFKTRKHLPGCIVRPERFPTDIKFSAFNQLHKARTSRKDDMMSLCYMLIYLMNQCRMPGLKYSSGNPSFVVLLKENKRWKTQYNLQQLCNMS